MDHILQEQLLEAYDQEKIDRKNQWDQEQLNEWEGFIVLEQLASIQAEIDWRVLNMQRTTRITITSWTINDILHK